MDLLKKYILEGEHQTQDFKFRVDDSKKIARTLAAFANTDGGRLLIGVKDNGKVVGSNPEEELFMVQEAVSLYCKPELQIKTNVLPQKHKLVLVIWVEETKNKPVRALDERDKWRVYVRRDDHTILANKILVGVWKHPQVENIPSVLDENQLLLLETIESFTPITLSQLYQKTKLNKAYIDQTLVLFVVWKWIEMDITPEGTFFKLFSG